jgi:hypothetical protein
MAKASGTASFARQTSGLPHSSRALHFKSTPIETREVPDSCVSLVTIQVISWIDSFSTTHFAKLRPIRCSLRWSLYFDPGIGFGAKAARDVIVIAQSCAALKDRNTCAHNAHHFGSFILHTYSRTPTVTSTAAHAISPEVAIEEFALHDDSR